MASTAPARFDPGPWRERLRRGRRYPEAEVSTWMGALLDTPVSSAN